MNDFTSKRILIVGDVMLDRYVYGDVTRISPEAPTQILDIGGIIATLGAAANAAKNITSLGARVTMISVIGDDEAGREILKQIGEEEGIIPYLLVAKGRYSTVKTRYVSGNYQLLRTDWEHDSDIDTDFENKVISLACAEIKNHDVVILSDYDKGVLTRNVIAEIVEECMEKDIPVIIDPKKTDWKIYAGATVLTPNLHELYIASGSGYNRSIVLQKADDCNIHNILVTRSREGMSLISLYGEHQENHIPASAKSVVDVTGAGDTVVGVLALGISCGLNLLESAMLANKAAGIVVGKPRTATITLQELYDTN